TSCEMTWNIGWVSRSLRRTAAKSACLPISIEPIFASSPIAFAPLSVAARSANAASNAAASPATAFASKAAVRISPNMSRSLFDAQPSVPSATLTPASRSAGGNLAVGQLGHVHGDQAVVDEAEFLQPLERAQAALGLFVLDLMRGLVRMQVHRNVELVGQHANALEALVRHRIRRVRCKGGADQVVTEKAVVHLAGTFEVLVLA